jgi:hypothetical protein
MSLVGIAMLCSLACTRSFPIVYEPQPQTQGLADAAEMGKVTIGVAMFEDKRSWINPSDSKSESFIAMQGPWKFGLTYKEKEYVAVKSIIQDLLVKELNNAGFKAKAVDKVVSKTNQDGLKEAFTDKSMDYYLGGQILTFEFVNETGIVTVTSRRSATINLNLYKNPNLVPAVDVAIVETDRENEGLGVLHTTNIKKLMDRVFRKVAQQITTKIAEQVSLQAKAK